MSGFMVILIIYGLLYFVSSRRIKLGIGWSEYYMLYFVCRPGVVDGNTGAASGYVDKA